MRGSSPLPGEAQQTAARRRGPGHQGGNDKKGVGLKPGRYKSWKRLKGFDFDEDWVAVALAALGEPSGKAFGEAFGSEAVAGFDAAFGDGKSFIEVSGIGEIAHAKLVEPIEGTGFLIALDDDVDRELLRVHASILASKTL